MSSMSSGEMINPDRQIVIEDAKIVEVGPRSTAGHSNAERIDLKGMTVMPGLIDCHCHVLQSTSNLAALVRGVAVLRRAQGVRDHERDAASRLHHRARRRRRRLGNCARGRRRPRRRAARSSMAARR